MWLFLEGGRFLSLAADPGDPERLLIRARLPGDIETDFPDLPIMETDGTEYRFQTAAPRERVMAVLTDELASIDYQSLRKTVCNQNRVTLAARCDTHLREAQEKAREGRDDASLCRPPPPPGNNLK